MVTVRANWKYDSSSSNDWKFSVVDCFLDSYHTLIAPGKLKRVLMSLSPQSLLNYIRVSIRIYDYNDGSERHSFHVSRNREFTPEDKILFDKTHTIITAEDIALHCGDKIRITTEIPPGTHSDLSPNVCGTISLLIELDL